VHRNMTPDALCIGTGASEGGRERYLTDGTVDDQAHGTARIVEDQVDHGVGERGSVELLGGDEELTGEPRPIRIRGERRRRGEGEEDRNEPAHGDKEHLMGRASPVTKAFFKIGERMFGQVPTPERLMAQRLPLMLGIGGLYGAIEWFATIDAELRALLNVQVATLYGVPY